MQVWFMPRDSGGPINKRHAERRVSRALAFEINRILELADRGRVLLGDSPMYPGDIAVLVRRNAQALPVRQELRRFGIPSVLYSTENIFDTIESEQLFRFLLAVEEPADEQAEESAEKEKSDTEEEKSAEA